MLYSRTEFLLVHTPAHTRAGYKLFGLLCTLCRPTCRYSSAYTYCSINRRGGVQEEGVSQHLALHVSATTNQLRNMVYLRDCCYMICLLYSQLDGTVYTFNVPTSSLFKKLYCLEKL